MEQVNIWQQETIADERQYFHCYQMYIMALRNYELVEPSCLAYFPN
jgi:hypothetical protein